MGNVYSEEEINTLLDALKTGEIDDGGLRAASSSANMKQKDIDLLVSMIVEVQQYREIGTIEECRQYKEKALGM